MGWRITVWMRSLWPIVALALVWGIGPAVGPLLQGELIGHGLTDLYPSVWGLWVFAEAQPGLPNHTDWIGGGMGYYYSSPIKGWLAWPMMSVFGLPATWNLLVLGARVATVACSYAAARAWGLGQKGALAAAAVYACSPFFHGYAVEGIAEGTDGWTLALWIWAIGAKRFRLAAIPFALTILSSWYLGMVACLLAALACLWDRRILWSGLGLILMLPAVAQFATAFPGAAPLAPDIRATMGASITIPTPGWHEGLNPFAKNTYVGILILWAALYSRTRWVLAAAIPALFSLGIGPIYELPVAELVRFPYRWHAATLVLLAPAVAITADRLRWGYFLGPLIALEGLLLAPTEPLLPGATAELPAYTQHIKRGVLEVPGPVAMAPGTVNRSRARAQYILYHQTAHKMSTPWIPDFNSVGIDAPQLSETLQAIQRLDPLVSGPAEVVELDITTPLPGVGQVVIQKRHLGVKRSTQLAKALRDAGWSRTFDDSTVSVFSDGPDPLSPYYPPPEVGSESATR